MLQLPHELISLAAPLHLHKGSHIAPCAVLTLQELHILWAQHQQLTVSAPIMSLRLCFEPPLQCKQGAEPDGLMQQQVADSQCSSGHQNTCLHKMALELTNSTDAQHAAAGHPRWTGTCLEGATVLGGHNVAHLLHHVTESLHLFRTAESLPHRHKLLCKN